MYPAIGVGQLRLVAADTVLAGHLKVPAGVVLWVPHHGIQNSSLNWDKPHTFLPGVGTALTICTRCSCASHTL